MHQNGATIWTECQFLKPSLRLDELFKLSAGETWMKIYLKKQ